MASPRLKVAGRDLSSYLVAFSEELEVVDPDRIEPSFSGSPAFREGLEFVADATGNKEWSLPLVLTAASRSELHKLIVDINNDLARGAQVEYCVDPDVDPSTFFDLEAGRLDVAHSYALSIHATQRAVLRLWTRPHGHTATSRLIASVSGTGPQEFNATGILGDADALATLEARVGSTVASAGRVVGYGVARSASYRGIRLASSLSGQASSLATAEATSSIGSTMVSVPVSPTGASGVAVTAYLSPPEAYVGRHRVFAVLRSNLSNTGHLKLYAKDRFGAPLGATVIASQNSPQKMMLADLGEIQVPARASGQDAVPTQEINLYAGGASGAAYAQASGYPLSLGGLMLFPVGNAPGLMRTRGIGGDQALYADNFNRIAETTFLQNSPNAVPGGGVWSRVAGFFGGAYSFYGLGISNRISPVASIGGGPYPVLSNTGAAPTGANASGLYALASGAQNGDVSMSGKLGIVGVASPAGASTTVELWSKALTNGSILTHGIGARLAMLPGSPALQLVLASNGATAGLASAVAASAAAIASGMWGGIEHTMTVQVRGNRVDMWFGTAITGSPILTASHAMAAMSGWPAVRMNAGSNIASAVIYLDDLSVISLSSGASDIAARETFRFQSYPEPRSYPGIASIFVADRAADFRGDPPRLPPVGSPGASGPARVIVFEGSVDDFRGNDVIDLALAVTERWTFLR